MADAVAKVAQTNTKTKGEALFEEYLCSQGITTFDYEKKYPGKKKRIDYTVLLDREYLFDAKDFTYTDVPEAGFYDPYRRLRGKIDKLREQFREYKDWPCCGVLYDDNAQLVDLTTPMIVLGAMYGNVGFSSQFNTETGEMVRGSEKEEFLSGGKMLLRGKKRGTVEVRNTTISALITLRPVRIGYARLCNDFEGRKLKGGFDSRKWLLAEHDFDQEEAYLGVIVWENAFAQLPFPRDVFSGHYDERYGVNEEGYLRRIQVGKGVAEYERLTGEQRSPIFRKASAADASRG